MPTVLLWLFQGVVSGMGSGVTSWMMGRLLTAILGSQTDPALKQALATIQNEIDSLAQLIDTLTKEVEQLRDWLNLSVKVLETYIEQAQISGDIAKIETHFLDLQTMLKTTIFDGTPATDPSDFAADTLDSWDIPVAVRAMSDALVGNEGLEKGLLMSWTEYLILQMNQPSEADLERAALMLQHLFTQQLNTQFMGTVLVCAAKSLNCNPKEPSKAAVEYLNGYQDLLAAQIEKYRQCVEMLVLSQFDMTVRASPLQFPTAAPAVFLRADLFTAIATNQPALTGRKIVSNGMLGNQIVPTMQPAPEYAASDGQVVAVPSGYKCADWDGSRPSEMALLDWNDSDFKIIRYQWPWPQPAPPVGKPINPEFQSGVAPGLYDRATMMPVVTPPTQDPDKTILFASFTDTTSVLTSLDLVSRPWSSFYFNNNKQTNVVVDGNVDPRAAIDGEPGTFWLRARVLDWNSVRPTSAQYSVGADIEFIYSGTRAIDANLLVSGTLHCGNADSVISLLDDCRIVISVAVGGASTAICDSGPQHRSFDIPVSGAAKVRLESGALITVSCRLEANAVGADYGKMLPSGQRGELQFRLDFLRLAWDLAEITP